MYTVSQNIICTYEEAKYCSMLINYISHPEIDHFGKQMFSCDFISLFVWLNILTMKFI